MDSSATPSTEVHPFFVVPLSAMAVIFAAATGWPLEETTKTLAGMGSTRGKQSLTGATEGLISVAPLVFSNGVNRVIGHVLAIGLLEKRVMINAAVILGPIDRDPADSKGGFRFPSVKPLVRGLTQFAWGSPHHHRATPAFLYSRRFVGKRHRYRPAALAAASIQADMFGYATTLIGKMVNDPTLKEQAEANDTVDAFANGAYETKLNNAVVDALENHSDMADQALRHEKVFKGLANLLVEEVYRQLREKSEESFTD